jgi:DNA-directed RNA polymerase subunit K/omega
MSKVKRHPVYHRVPLTKRKYYLTLYALDRAAKVEEIAHESFPDEGYDRIAAAIREIHAEISYLEKKK